MMKNLPWFCLFLFLSACSVPKDYLAGKAYKVHAGDMLIREYPELAYCFGVNSADASTDLNWIWKKVVRENERDLEPFVGPLASYRHGAKWGTIAVTRYFIEKGDKYLPPSLNISQRKKCEALIGSTIFARFDVEFEHVNILTNIALETIKNCVDHEVSRSCDVTILLFQNHPWLLSGNVNYTNIESIAASTREAQKNIQKGKFEKIRESLPYFLRNPRHPTSNATHGLGLSDDPCTGRSDCASGYYCDSNKCELKL